MEIPWYVFAIAGVVVLAFLCRKQIARAILFRKK